MSQKPERFYVQSHHVRGEPRYYWIVDREGRNPSLPDWTTSRRRMDRLCAKLNSEAGATEKRQTVV